MQTNWWDDKAHQGIVGLSPGPWVPGDAEFAWPTDGYDGHLDSSWGNPRGFAESGHTQEEWLALADHMIQRWQDFRYHLLSLPPEDA